MRRQKTNNNFTETENSFGISISDLMAGLLSIFILALCYYMLSFTQKEARIVNNTEVRTQILNEIAKEMQKNKNGIRIEIDEANGVLTLPEDEMFDTGSSVLKQSGRNLVKSLAMVLNRVLRKQEYDKRVETIFIEGHTDNQSYHGQLEPNWNLSTQRAINTWKILRDTNGTSLESLKNNNKQPLFSCSGYAYTRPIAPNDERHRAKNRRIALRFTMTPPSKDDAVIIGAIKKEMNKVK